MNCFGQQYDKLFIEKSKIDKNNIIYSVGNTFVYEIEVLTPDGVNYIDKNDKDSLTFGNENALQKIQLNVEKSKLFGRTNKNQTEIKYNDYPNPTFRTSTGLVENEINIWLHPPRFGFLRALETCPFPYIKLNEQIGFKWKDEMLISDYWSDKRWEIWKDKLLLKYNYEIVGEETINTEFGKLNTTKIYATANSEIGQSSLTSYFNEKYGFVKLEYILFSGIKINLNLKEYINEKN
ncbi:hypothetical protein [Empedobacter brevis]|uniref:hypothetical protein n=1 Tax=Empedobacter brevis TaxID=247 RepID=UPI0039AEC397